MMNDNAHLLIKVIDRFDSYSYDVDEALRYKYETKRNVT